MRRAPPPLVAVRERLAERLSPAELDRLPRHYFRLGDVLLLDLPIPGDAAEVASAYASTLGMRTVLGAERGIEGEFRLPGLRHLWGEPVTETEHVEGGLHYRLDARRIMWSPGNLTERRRVATFACTDQTVVDFFAGVGYFSVPIAARAGPRRVVAIDKNPEAAAYLRTNIRLNGVDDRVAVVEGDCRDVAPHAEADRVLLGLLPDALPFVGRAVECLRPKGGTLHVHRAVPDRQGREGAWGEIAARVEALGRRARLDHVQHVKSYGPHKEHLVFDVGVGPA